MGGEGVPRWVVGTLKWLVTLGVLAAVVVFAVPQLVDLATTSVSIGQAGETETPEPVVTEPETVSGSAPIVDDLSARDGAAFGVETGAIQLGTDGADEFYLAFEQIPVDSACLTNVSLFVFLLESDETPIYATPAQLRELSSYAEGDPLPADSLVLGVGEVPAYTSGAGGFLQWNLTNEYAVASTSVGRDNPVVFALTPDPEVAGGPEVSVNSTLVAAQAPEEQRAYLQWTATQACAEGFVPGAELTEEPEPGDAADTDVDPDLDPIEPDAEEA